MSGEAASMPKGPRWTMALAAAFIVAALMLALNLAARDPDEPPDQAPPGVRTAYGWPWTHRIETRVIKPTGAVEVSEEFRDSIMGDNLAVGIALTVLAGVAAWGVGLALGRLGPPQ